MSSVINTNVLVFGGGPGGYVAAIRCGQLGLETVLVDADRLGGTCLIRGCIPSKAIIHAATEFETMVKAARSARFGISLTSPPSLDFSAMIGWKETLVDRLNTGVTTLLKRAKVKTIAGHGRFSDAKTCIVSTPNGDSTIHAKNVILAAGSVPIELPNLPFGGKVISSTEALSLTQIPTRLVVIGGGYIGLELGSAYAKFGSKVTIVEAQKRLLPLYDDKLVEPVRRWLQAAGVEVHLESKALEQNDEGLLIETKSGEHLSLAADKILVTVGRRPATENWGLEEMAVAMAGRCVKIDDHCATSTKNVWAIGDLVGEPMLAHKASAQGEIVAEIVAGERARFDVVAIPAICFTEPEIVSVGAGPDTPNTVTGVFPFSANGRALSIGAGDNGGFIRVIARNVGHRIIGVQAVGSHISELAATFTSAVETGMTLEDVRGIIFAHPTLGEAFREASLKALGDAIHI